MATKGERVARTATEALKVLWETGFFHGWKKKAPVVESLAKRGNNFSDPELGMALKRASHLTRRGKRGNYEYIQKYPFEADHGSKNTAIKKKKRGSNR